MHRGRIPTRTLIFLFPFVALIGAIALGGEHTKDTLAVVKANVDQGKAVIVDVREKKEWDEAHLKDALHLPLSRLQKWFDPKSQESEIAKDKILYTHCRAGGRSLVAADILKKLGYDVRPLKQGTTDLLLTFPKAE